MAVSSVQPLQADEARSPFAVSVSSTLDELQTDEQRRVLDVVSRIRKFGLNTFLDLPQIVVCGDQSSGKSSVLEALTRIRFPTSDNLCTRFATEINLRREDKDGFAVRVVPHDGREENDKVRINAFRANITDLESLPAVMEEARKVMRISSQDENGRAFSLDVLSIDIFGPERPQLSVVDIPGLIQSSTKGVSVEDVKLVGEITDRYISRSRTICLAVISATNDAANQGILQRVRKFDQKGRRTLGVITKIDLLPDGSGAQNKFLELAHNEDVVFDLGWHIIRNRKFEESGLSFDERDQNEALFFASSPFNKVNRKSVGIDALRVRLSQLLYEHVRMELPKLLHDTSELLQRDESDLELLGGSRSTPEECRQYLLRLCMVCHDITRGALEGNYHNEYFHTNEAKEQEPQMSTRLRATLQKTNANFSDAFRLNGHKFQLSATSDSKEKGTKNDMTTGGNALNRDTEAEVPKLMPPQKALRWVQKKLELSRGTELSGNFNPNLVAELFWEQSEKWSKLGENHVSTISQICSDFFSRLMVTRIPRDVRARFKEAMVDQALGARQAAALKELKRLLEDRKDFPINYNHYYIDNILKQRQDRLSKHIQGQGSSHFDGDQYYDGRAVTKWLGTCVAGYGGNSSADMDKFSCEEALDCLISIYKVQQKTFIANMTTQVIERRMLRGLAETFSPLKVIDMKSSEVEAIVAEKPGMKRHRAMLESRIAKLRGCCDELRRALAAPTSE